MGRRATMTEKHCLADIHDNILQQQKFTLQMAC
jgi:hypothetical protein